MADTKIPEAVENAMGDVLQAQFRLGLVAGRRGQQAITKDAPEVLEASRVLLKLVDALRAALSVQGEPQPVGWAQLGMRNGHTYVRMHYDREPYPPPPDVQRNLNLVPLFATPAAPAVPPDDAKLMDLWEQYGTAPHATHQAIAFGRAVLRAAAPSAPGAEGGE